MAMSPGGKSKSRTPVNSRESRADNQDLEIVVGFAQNAPWKMADTDRTNTTLVDDALKTEADKLAASRSLGCEDGHDVSAPGIERGA